MAEYDRTTTEIRSAYEQKASDAMLRLQEERDMNLRNLDEETKRRLHELGRQAQRIERG